MPMAGDTRRYARLQRAWPRLKVSGRARQMNADILHSDIARLVEIIEAAPVSRDVSISRIELDGRYDHETGAGELALVLYSNLSPDAAAAYQQQLEDGPKNMWEASLAGETQLRLADLNLRLVVLPLGVKAPWGKEDAG